MVGISIRLKRKQPALLLLSVKLKCIMKITGYIKSTNNDHLPFALKRAKPKKSPNLLYHPNIKQFRFHTVFNSLIRQRKCLPSLGTAAIYRTRNKVLPCVGVCACLCVHILYRIVNMNVTKKKINQVCSIILAHFSNLFNYTIYFFTEQKFINTSSRRTIVFPLVCEKITLSNFHILKPALFCVFRENVRRSQ